MSTIKADAIEAATGTNTDLDLSGKGTGVPDLAAGFKVGSVAGVPTASIRDDAVTLAKLAAGTDGELITWDASGDPATVAVGTATHILTSNGAGAAPTFQAAAGGGGAWNFIATGVADDSTTTLGLSGIDTTYDVYHVSITNLTMAADGNQTWFRVGDSGGVKTDSLYYANISKNGTTAATHDAAVDNPGSSALMFDNFGNAAGESASANLWIHRTGQNCLINGTLTYQKNDGTIRTGYCGIWYKDSSFALTQVQLTTNTGNIKTGRMTLWGIAHA